MFRMQLLSPTKELAGTLKLKEKPNFLGIYEDIKGVKWDINCIYGCNGEQHVCARVVDDAPIYRTDTASCYQGYNLTWLPYKVEVIN